MKFWHAIIIIVLTFSLPCEAKISYQTVEKSVSAGLSWGSGNKQINRMKRMFRLYYPWLWKFGGSRDPAWLSFLIMTETAGTGNPFTKTKDTKLGECGLTSIKRWTAKQYGIDCCNSQANIWAAGKYHHDDIQPMLEKYGDKAFFKKMDYADQYLFFAWLGNTSPCIKGTALAQAMLNPKKWPGNHPYMISLGWLKQMGEKLMGVEYEKCWGRTNAQTHAFRFAREKAMRDLLIRVYGGGKKGRAQWAKCVRPDDILKTPPQNNGYPGDKEHGCCCSDCSESAHGTGCWEKWNMPPDYRFKYKNGKKVDLWKNYCHKDKCVYEEVFAEWKQQKMKAGILPSQEEYDSVKMEMKKQGCFILDY